MSLPKNNPDPSRRSFLASAAVAASAALVGMRPRSAAAAGSLPHLSESDPLAKSLGYQSSASKVDKSKFPTYKAGEHCGLCRFFQGTPGQSSGYAGCQIFAGYSVDAGGWCASFNARS
ncbi:MAG: high-potential iron-sulfur protein [Steroidobacteraceae bacterium]